MATETRDELAVGVIPKAKPREHKATRLSRCGEAALWDIEGMPYPVLSYATKDEPAGVLGLDNSHESIRKMRDLIAALPDVRYCIAAAKGLGIV